MSRPRRDLKRVSVMSESSSGKFTDVLQRIVFVQLPGLESENASLAVGQREQ